MTAAHTENTISAHASVLRTSCWCVIRTYNRKETIISNYLTEQGIEHFIPMTYSERKDREGKMQRVLVPVVHNLIFFRKDRSDKALASLLAECPVPLSIMKEKSTGRVCEIPESQMVEFRYLCDPNFSDTRILIDNEAEALPGKEVRIVRGPFVGMSGKLHRVKNNYYFIKTLSGIGVMIRISRWYCQIVDDV